MEVSSNGVPPVSIHLYIYIYDFPWNKPSSYGVPQLMETPILDCQNVLCVCLGPLKADCSHTCRAHVGERLQGAHWILSVFTHDESEILRFCLSPFSMTKHTFKIPLRWSMVGEFTGYWQTYIHVCRLYKSQCFLCTCSQVPINSICFHDSNPRSCVFLAKIHQRVAESMVLCTRTIWLPTWSRVTCNQSWLRRWMARFTCRRARSVPTSTLEINELCLKWEDLGWYLSIYWSLCVYIYIS